MLRRGTKDLDQLLSFGQPQKAIWGLEYNGKEYASTMFVHGKKLLKEQVTINVLGECFGPKYPKATQMTTGQVSATATTRRTQETDIRKVTS